MHAKHKRLSTKKKKSDFLQKATDGQRSMNPLSRLPVILTLEWQLRAALAYWLTRTSAARVFNFLSWWMRK